MIKKLDNPVWHSLSETHKKISIVYKDLKFYEPDYCPFGGLGSEDDFSAQIDEYSKLIDSFFVVGGKPKFSEKIILKNELVCLQMIIENHIDLESKENIIRLNDKHGESLYSLVNLV